MARDLVRDSRRIVVKIGTRVLTEEEVNGCCIDVPANRDLDQRYRARMRDLSEEIT